VEVYGLVVERFVSLGAIGGVVRSQPGILEERPTPQHGRPRRPGERAGRLAVAFVGLVTLIVAGGMIGRLVYQVVERPRTVVVTTVGCSLVGTDSAKPGDVFQMWAYPYGKVLASATKVEMVSRDVAADEPPRLVVYFEVNRHTPDFQIVDATASLIQARTATRTSSTPHRMRRASISATGKASFASLRARATLERRSQLGHPPVVDARPGGEARTRPSERYPRERHEQMNDHMLERSVAWSSRAFIVALAVWVVAAAVLGIPHGVGHSIEKMTLVQTIRDIALPVWGGALAGLVGILTARAAVALGRAAGRSS
jgi:hypothetical protein